MAPVLLSLSQLLVHGHPVEQVAFQVAEQPLTWGQLEAVADAWLASLRASSYRRVALHFTRSFEFAGALLGALRAGVNVEIAADTLAPTLSALETRVDAFVGDFPLGLGKPTLPRTALLAAGSRPQPAGSAASEVYSASLGIFTSGSTGAPELFEKSVAQLDAEISCLEATFGEHAVDSVVLATVSHHHIYGLLFKILWPLCAGRVVVDRVLFFPEEICAELEKYPACTFVTSPAHLTRLPETLDYTHCAPHVRVVFSSGGALPWAGALLTCQLLGRAPIEVYGSSETGGIAFRERTQEAALWRPFADTQIKIDEAQVLSVSSPKLPGNAWFRTSDRARAHGDDTFELLGRIDRIVKIEEKRVSLSAIEMALKNCTQVLDARVLPLPGARQVLGAIVVLNSAGLALGAKLQRERLKAALAPQVEAICLPKRWRFVAVLPLNSQGKTTARDLLALFENHESA